MRPYDWIDSEVTDQEQEKAMEYVKECGHMSRVSAAFLSGMLWERSRKKLQPLTPNEEMKNLDDQWDFMYVKGGVLDRLSGVKICGLCRTAGHLPEHIGNGVYRCDNGTGAL